MRRLTTFAMVSMLLLIFLGCKQTQEDRYQRYLEEVADTSSMIEYITPEADSIAPPVDEGEDPFANDEGIYTIPEIPQEREVNMNTNTYEIEKEMRGGR